jgi:hypothetical protein
MKIKKLIKVFVGLVEIAGTCFNLTKAFKEIGVNCDYITFTTHPFKYGGKKNQPTFAAAPRI